jgi:hypothetical protein
MKGYNGIDYYMPIQVFLLEYTKYIVDGIIYSNEKGEFSTFEFVVKPLLENCIYSYVYGLKDNSELYIENREILIKEKGKYKFDITKDCINGHEYLWGAVASKGEYKRGSIIIILENDLNIFDNIFKHTYYDIHIQGDYPVNNNPNSGNTISAIKKCKEEMKKGNIGVCLSASNGLEAMNIYIEEKYKNELIKKYMNKSKKIDYNKIALDGYSGYFGKKRNEK